MRIVGGYLRGRTIQAPKGRVTRPMTDRTREALFNVLGDINGFAVLDAYAGSGAVGLEALSRGAAYVDGVEKSYKATQAITSNIAKLGVGKRYRLYRESMEKWVKANTDKYERYDLIFFCPPHALINADVLNATVPYLKPKKLLVVEHFFKDQAPAIMGADFIRSVSYGESALSLFRKK